MTARATFAVTFVGMLLVQVAWMLVVPPFGGIDEHEHAFKAAAVARGDLGPHHEASTQGWGEFVDVPASIARAARSQCQVLPYTGSDNCVGFPDADGTVRIATSAARYNPAYYVVVGLAGRPFSGATSLYAMRAVSALLCALMITAALLVTRAWARTPWPSLTLLLGLTPTAVYTTTVVAPNGVEICGGALLWTSLVGLRSDVRGRLHTTTLIGLATVGSVPLLAVRTLGPLWWLLIVGGAVITLGSARTRELGRLRPTRVFLAVAALAGGYGLVWSAVAGSNSLNDDAPTTGSPWVGMPVQWLLWFFQTIAAAPYRNQYAPIVVYAVMLTMIGLAAGLALRAATRRLRLALLYVVTAGTLVAVGFTATAYASSGFIWQGRYLYPFTVGFFVLVGLALDRPSRGLSLDHRFAAALVGLTIVSTQAASLIAVRDYGVRTSPLAGGAWHVPSAALVIALVAVGTGLLLTGTRTGPSRSSAPAPVGATAAPAVPSAR